MKRREFIGALGKAAATMLLYPDGVFPEAAGSRYLVETPEKRAQYLARVLKMLCTDIGPRPAGSRAYDQAAEVIKKEMDLALPVTELDWFRFRGWRLLDEPVFYCGDQSLEGYPYFGCGDTPEGGVRGILKKSDRGGLPFSVVDQASGKAVAYVSISPYGRAVPMSPFGLPQEIAGLPLLCVGKQDLPVLEKAVENATQVHIRFKAEVDPNARSCNIVGTLPGETDEEILFLAHADTVYNTPGANDNTASVMVMLMLAHAASGARMKRTITFVATGAEEYDLLGAKHYAAKRKAVGTLEKIEFCVNFDSLTYGPNLYIHSKDEALKRIMAEIHADLNLHNAYDKAYPIAPEYFNKERALDCMPFVEAGARTLDLNSRGYDEKTLPLWHRPEDTPETVPLDCVENSFLIFDEYIRRVQLL